MHIRTVPHLPHYRSDSFFSGWWRHQRSWQAKKKKKEVQFNWGVRTPGVEKGTEEGQSSYIVVTHCPTKPQSQDCTGYKKSYKTNTPNAATATATTFIVKTSSFLHSQFHWEGTALRKTAPRFVILSMTEWAGPEFMYHGNVASINQVTKPKKCGVHKVLHN